MAERQETSVMVSLQEILRDAQSRDEQDKLEVERRAREEEQNRLDGIRLRQEQEQARVRAEEEDRQRRAFEEQRRQAEILAMQEAAVARAKAEAEAQARLAEMTARQDHERKLHAVSHDGAKKRLQMLLAGLGILLFALAIGGGVAIKSAMDKATAAEARATELEGEKAQVEAQEKKIQAELDKAPTPAERDRLQKRLEEAQAAALLVAAKIAQGSGAPVRQDPAAVARPPVPANRGPAPKKCDCTPGDPMCSCL